ncbi:MAG: hypothetical protein IKB93_16080, partial [Clostridia bacterium]|nr:hypothetical protein [Clostridia bacterium]
IAEKNTGAEAYVFSEYNSFFANEQSLVVGKCFYLHSHMLNEKQIGHFKTKIILNKKFLNLGYKKINNYFEINSDMNIKKFVSDNQLFSEKNSNNIFCDNYSAFDENCVVAVSEPRAAMQKLYEKNADLKKVVDKIVKDFSMNIEDLGLTGSLALGCNSSFDYDIIFYGSIEKLNQIKRKIDYYQLKNGKVKEYGLNWPCRYYDDNSNLICCFFNCIDYSYQPLRCAEIMDNKYQFSTTVKEDVFSILKAPVLEIDGNIGSLVIFNSAFKGVLKKGDKINGVGKIIKYNIYGKEKYSILCLNPYDEIYDYGVFFNR